MSAPTFCFDGSACTADSCNADTGCVFEAKDCGAGAFCDAGTCYDKPACATDEDCAGDTCAIGACIGGFCDYEPLCDDDNPCTWDQCQVDCGKFGCTATCSNTPNYDSCDDGDWCTQNDNCVAGECVGGGLTYCWDDDPCTTDVCDSVQKECVYAPVACGDGEICIEGDCVQEIACGDLAGCSDGDPCTQDVCKGGFCWFPPLCDDANPCTTDSCEDGACKYDPAALQGTDCAVTPCEVATCDAGTCVWKGPKVCDDDDACTWDECQNEGCTSWPTNCDDGNPCTEDGCDPAIGCLNVAVACPDGQACVAGGCQVFEPCATDADCAGNAFEPCDVFACTDGLCLPTPKCFDGDQCTEDHCEVTDCNDFGCSATCSFTVVMGWPCEDGDACTTNDSCGADGCVGQAMYCDDDDPCTEDKCDAGQCVATAIVCGADEVCVDGQCLTSQPCAADSDCTANDACVGAACKAGQCVTFDACDDQNPCTIDGCNPLGCVYEFAAAGEPCGGDACNPSICSADGVCAAQPAPNCDDGSACTTEWCDADAGCQYQAVDCSTADLCTIASCNPDFGCDYQPLCESPKECVDGQCVDPGTCVPQCDNVTCGEDGCGGFCAECTAGTQCSDGQCVTPITCADAVTCVSGCADGSSGCMDACKTQTVGVEADLASQLFECVVNECASLSQTCFQAAYTGSCQWAYDQCQAGASDTGGPGASPNECADALACAMQCPDMNCVGDCGAQLTSLSGEYEAVMTCLTGLCPSPDQSCYMTALESQCAAEKAACVGQ